MPTTPLHLMIYASLRGCARVESCQMLFLVLVSAFVSSVNLPDPSIRIGLVRAIGHPESLVIVAPRGAKLTDPLGSSLGEGPAEWQFKSGENGVAAIDSTGKVLITGPALRVEAPLEKPLKIIAGA